MTQLYNLCSKIINHLYKHILPQLYAGHLYDHMDNLYILNLVKTSTYYQK
jgi:hypothetical protein